MTINRFSAPEIYLDANATTHVLPAAVEAMTATMQENFGNPSSSHITGIKAKHLLETTRKLAQQVVGAGEGDIVFTSGATEGIQIAILSALNACRAQAAAHEKPLLLYGATEHKAVPNSLHHWNDILQLNAEVRAIPVNYQGLLDRDFIAAHAKDAMMICTMAVNNETGVIQDIAAIERIIREQNPDVLWMVDSVQALGKLDVDLQNTSIDYAPFSGHKLYAPKGVGFLYVRENAPYTPVIAGGGQESGKRSGTENLPGIAALKAVFECMLDTKNSAFHPSKTLYAYRDKLVATLRESFPSLVFNNDLAHSVPTTINFSVAGISSREVMDLFDAAGIRVSSGSACSSGVTRSFVLDAMNLPAWQSESAIRMSFGPATQAEDIDLACETLAKIRPALSHACILASDTEMPQLTSGLLQLVDGEHCCWMILDTEHKQSWLIDPVSALDRRIRRILDCQDVQVDSVYFTDDRKRLDYIATGSFTKSITTNRSAAFESLAHYQVDAQHGKITLTSSHSNTQLHIFAERTSVEKATLTQQRNASKTDKTTHILAVSHDESGVFLMPPPEQVTAKVSQIPADDALTCLNRGDTTLIDVRESYEFEAWGCTNHQDHGFPMLNLPVSRIAEFLMQPDLARDSAYVLVCRSGRRSGQIANSLNDYGFTHLSNIIGGYALLEHRA